MSFPTVYYITQVIPSCYSAGYAMCVCVSFGACVYRSLALAQYPSKDGWIMWYVNFIKQCLWIDGFRNPNRYNIYIHD